MRRGRKVAPKPFRMTLKGALLAPATESASRCRPNWLAKCIDQRFRLHVGLFDGASLTDPSSEGRSSFPQGFARLLERSDAFRDHLVALLHRNPGLRDDSRGLAGRRAAHFALEHRPAVRILFGAGAPNAALPCLDGR